ncbi:MAG: hypothetical protein IKE65_05260 [Clostridia bacterium]|nr:hypothetical protein [Clostridia bacterium]
MVNLTACGGRVVDTPALDYKRCDVGIAPYRNVVILRIIVGNDAYIVP